MHQQEPGPDSDKSGLSQKLPDTANSTVPATTLTPSEAEPHRHLQEANLYNTEEERLKAYAHLLDSAIRLPGGFRIGLDGIVGLVPGIGDLLGAGLSGYFIYAASRLDIPKPVITRMILNTAIETVVGMVPVLGDAFDFVFKANDRNARLLRAALEARDRGQSRTF